MLGKTVAKLSIVAAFTANMDAHAQTAAIPEPNRPQLAFTHVNIVDVVTGETMRNMTLIISGNRIASIKRASVARVPARAIVVDARGKYLIPGMWDAHVHAFTAPESTITLGRRAIDVFFPQYLAAGVTGVRDMGGWVDTVMEVRRELRNHQVLGPRIVAAGRLLGGKNPWAPPSPHAWVITDPDSARAAVDSMRRVGADFIKVHDFLKRDVYFAIAAAARQAGLPLVGHLRPSVTVDEAITAGQIGMEHLPIELVVACAGGDTTDANNFYDVWAKGGWAAFISETARLWNARDARTCNALLKRMKQVGVYVTPTLVLRMQDSSFLARVNVGDLTPANRNTCAMTVKDWGSVPDTSRDRYYRTTFEIVRALFRSGVGILAGTDGPGGCLVPGASLHDELENFVRAGFTPAEALRSATLEPARFLGLSDSLGTIKLHKVADLVLLNANPLENIRNARLVAGVVTDGRWVSREEIRKRQRDRIAYALPERAFASGKKWWKGQPF